MCMLRPKKKDSNRTHITIGGNHIKYLGNMVTKTVSLDLVKLVLNCVLSHKDAKFDNHNIMKFYPKNPLNRPEYICIKLRNIRQTFI